jgi:dipeptidyl-peptidase-4
MKLNTTLFLYLLLFPFLLSAQDQVTAETYQQAESQLSFNTSQYVDRMNVRANWESDDQFWYKVLIKDGVEFVHYDIKKKKKTIFDSRAN